jgi:hypothetical protein
MPYVKHSRKDIMRVLAILQSCGYCYYRTEAKTKVDRITIKRWYEKYKAQMPERLPASLVEKKPMGRPRGKKPVLTLDERKIEYEKNLFETKEEILKHLRAVIVRNCSVKYLAESLKIINDLDKILTPPPGQGGVQRPQLLQTILQNVKKLEINNTTQILNANGPEND